MVPFYEVKSCWDTLRLANAHFIFSFSCFSRQESVSRGGSDETLSSPKSPDGENDDFKTSAITNYPELSDFTDDYHNKIM